MGCKTVTYHQLENLNVATAGEHQVLGDAALHFAGNETGDASNVVAVLDHAPCYLQCTFHSSTQHDNPPLAAAADGCEGTQ